jgi:hypothetical protein
MDDPENQAAEYRRQAAACNEVAQRMSLREDRAIMFEMAQRWLDLAHKAEAAERAQASRQQQQRGSQLPPPLPQQGHQPALQQEQIQPTDKKDS